VTIPHELRARVLAHLDDEPDADDRARLVGLLEAGDGESLALAFGAPIAFGTAGLRAAVSPGPSGMNLRNVLRATRALLETLDAEVPDARQRGVVVAFDARPTSSRFADAVVSLATSSGFRVLTFAAPTATPIAAFAANRLGSAAAVVITASHNPAGDNGMKVYGPNAAQIVPPWDRLVADRMNDDRPTPVVSAIDSAQVTVLDESIASEHRARCVAVGETDAPRASIRVAYTALHGVGEAPVRAALDALGEVELHSVASQARPDGSFPTARKPNPENPAALAQVVELTHSIGADAYMATDPDADRLAVGVVHQGELVHLHGDELGVLFATTLVPLEGGRGPSRPLLLTTVVSSPWMARCYPGSDVRVETTLTGHKWIHDRAIALEKEGYAFVFGYEEALGYAFANGVRDKDGIAAAVVFARLLGTLRHEDRTPIDHLEAVARSAGMHRSRQVTLSLEGVDAPRRLEARMAALRVSTPDSIAGRAVLATIDGRSSELRHRDGTASAISLPPSSLLGFVLEDETRVLLRASGTEPKLKIYLDARARLGPDERYLEGRKRLESALDPIAMAMPGLLWSV